ncbi:ROK family protein [Virgibacillus sp. C22-A2]|uniref:ROK family protein n=1 Tax=Virgibacillus tibetensis TaxID=3042313 RepID=A0ABU6KE39_9BACI|nr:ROK family protein [Virgibacillus sp. C22-A2]
MGFSIGVDIGGTKIAAVITDQSGNVHYRNQVESVGDDKEEMFNQVVLCVEELLEASNISIDNIDGMGVGVPGKVDRDKGIAVFQNNLPWRNFPLVERLAEHFPIENIEIDNDVYMAAFAEWQLSEVNEKDTFVYVTVSTGISCSIIHNGDFLRGDGFAGEIGLFPVISRTSKEGVNNLEKAASGPAIQQLAREQLSNSRLTTQDFFLLYEKKEKQAEQLMKEIAESIAHGVYSIICLLDPHKIVFGGGVVNNNPHLLELVKESVKDYVIPEQQEAVTRMQVSQLKEDSGVVGAGLKGMKNLHDLS